MWFVGWVLFFAAICWGVSGYIAGLCLAYEKYREKETAVCEDWNREHGRWQYVRLKGSKAYKYIEIHVNHGKECAWCTAQKKKEDEVAAAENERLSLLCLWLRLSSEPKSTYGKCHTISRVIKF